jgi:glyoxylase-like metal-dependent hydrolase (beta-lactamase superfamily II)
MNSIDQIIISLHEKAEISILTYLKYLLFFWGSGLYVSTGNPLKGADMKEILPGIFLLRGLFGSNAYLLKDGNRLALIDCGMPGDAYRFARRLTASGFDLSQVDWILITHAHADHTGGLSRLARLTDARVAVHKDEASYVQQDRGFYTHSWVMEIIKQLTILGKHTKAVHVDQVLEDQDRLDILGGLVVIHTPGHTPGSVSYYQPERKILFCGDALLNQNPFTFMRRFSLPIPLVTADTAQARKSVEKLSALQIEALFTGHGDPLLEDVNSQISALLKEK